MQRSDIEPFYFGPQPISLFGCYHAPLPGRMRSTGVILCYPIGHEYIAAHRAYKHFAIRLSQAGFPVLRFDFSGSGDSAGNADQSRIAQWLADIATAVREIRRRGRTSRVCLAGLRLGGSLAYLFAAQQGEIEGLVLWDPVVSGKAYIEELIQSHRETLRQMNGHSRDLLGAEQPGEILGFPFPKFLHADLSKLDLLAIRKKPANDMFLLTTDERPDPESATFISQIKNMDIRIVLQRCPVPQLWREDVNKVLVPNQVLESIVTWMSRVFP